VEDLRELGKIYEKHGFKDKALEVYEKLYKIEKSDEIKKKIEKIKSSDKEDILDLEDEEKGGESLFSELDKKAPIQMDEENRLSENEEKSEGGEEEEVDDSFREWIDGLGGASSG
jgi:hypothetical protein